MNLIIDIGNTYAKLALFQEGQLMDVCREGDSLQDAFRHVTAHKHIDRCIVSSVVDLDTELISFFKDLPFPCIWMDNKTPVPIKIEYGTPNTLGVDRIAAVVGAWKKYPGRDVLVIDAGTAITYDFISKDGVFYGGNIAPGKQLRFYALHNRIMRLPVIDENGDAPVAGYDTVTAIRGGVMRGIAYEMDGYIEEYRTRYPDMLVVLTGGDSLLFKDRLKSAVLVDHHLVLKGLNSILDYNEKF